MPGAGAAAAAGGLGDRLGAEAPVRLAREALGGSGPAWIVGGAVRDALLGRPVTDLDLAVPHDAEQAARAIADAARGPAFALSEAFGAWRVVSGDREWVCDVSPLHGQTIEEDLRRRDFSVNAMALPLQGGELVDPHGGAADLEQGVLRVLGPEAYAEDPLRPLRLARLAAELGLQPDDETERLTAAAAGRVTDAAPERVFAELRRLVLTERVLEGLALAERLGLLAATLPELTDLHGVEQSHFHHLDVYEHTMEVLRRDLELERDLEPVFGELAPCLEDVLDESLADELTRGQALRFAALLHDIGKPATRAVRDDGRVTFIGHDSVGEKMIHSLLRRLRASEKLASFVGSITRHHLVLGFLVHQRPLDRGTVYRYLTLCQPVEIEVTLVTCADRLATRGQNADPAIAAHLELAAELMDPALEWRAQGPPALPLRGDELAAELEIEPGPELGRLIEELRGAVYRGEVSTRAEAVEAARRLRDNP